MTKSHARSRRLPNLQPESSLARPDSGTYAAFAARGPWHGPCSLTAGREGPGGHALIDTYFKQHFWTFHLLVIAAAAFLVARTVNAYVGAALVTPPDQIATAAAPIAKADRPAEAPAVPLSAFLDRNIFHAAREDLVAAKAAAGGAGGQKENAAQFDPNNCEKSSLALGLLATVVAKEMEDSIAVFEDRTKKEPIAHRIGDKVLEDAELVSVEWRRVTMRHGGRCEFLALEEEDASKPAASPYAMVANPISMDGDAPIDSDLGKSIRKVSDSEYDIPRKEIEGVLGNLNTIATQARIVPSFINGKANGFKLFSIRPGSLYSKIGIQNGDVVQKINGYEMNSPDKALEIYSKLKDAQAINVDIVRGGKTQTLSYQIR